MEQGCSKVWDMWIRGGDKSLLRRRRQNLGNFVLAILLAGCGNINAASQTPVTPPNVSIIKPLTWGVPNEIQPVFFYASDVPEVARNRVEETFSKVTKYWPNHGPLEVWVTGIKTAPVIEMINEYCSRRVALKQMNKFDCLDSNRNGDFEEFRKWSAIYQQSGQFFVQGVATDTSKYGFHQIVISYPFGFTEEHPELAGKYQQVIFHEYFHIIQDAAIPRDANTANIPAVRNRLMGPRWFSEGTAEYMSWLTVEKLRKAGELPIYEGHIDDYTFTSEMIKKLKGAKASLSKDRNITLADAEHLVEKISPYEIGPWAVAYLINKSNPNVLMDVVYPNIAKLGWVKTFKLAFGMRPAEFEKVFMRFMRLTEDEQTSIL